MSTWDKRLSARHQDDSQKAKMKILFLAARLPYPLDTGAKIRAYHILKGLAHEHEVTLLAFHGSTTELEHVGPLSKLGINVVPVLNQAINKGVSPWLLIRNLFSRLPVTVQKYQSETFRIELSRLLNDRYDIVHCEHLHVAHYADSQKNCRKVLDAHNVEAEIIERMCAVETNALKRAFLAWHAAKVKRFEQSVVRYFDLVLAVSDRDRAALKKMSGRNNVSTVENGVDVDHFVSNGGPKNGSLVFVGSMDWLPNVDGIKYFVDDILPLIQREVGAIPFYVVGKNPPRDITELAKKKEGVIVTGAVDDVRPYIDAASVYVVPLRFGGGTRLKVLEAFAMGKTVVSTSLGSEGIDFKAGEHLLIADDPKAFAECVITLLKNEKRNEQMRRAARKLAEERYSWHVIENKLLQYYHFSTDNDRT